MRRIALVMAGGTGERFWPLSRRNKPKQLLDLTGSGRVMLEEAVLRVEEIFGIENIYVITGQGLVDAIRDELPGISSHVFAEPSKKNTAGAIVWGMGIIAGLLEDEDLSFAIIPSDHRIQPARAFQSKLLEAIHLAETEQMLVTIGIHPTRPETGYGYIELGDKFKRAHKVARFTEKPDNEQAENLVKGGNVLWNSGMFFWKLSTFRTELETASPKHARALEEIILAVRSGRTSEAERRFTELPDISIDHALMEKSDRVAVMGADFQWDDVGSWAALSRVLPGDKSGNTLVGSAEILESQNTVVYNSNPDQSVQVLGMDDVVVVVTPESVMVCPKSRAQEVKKLAR